MPDPLRASLVLLRIGTALLFMAHAVVRIANGTIPRFADFMGNLGFPQPLWVVLAITATELIGGTMMIVGFRARYAAIALASIAFGGIVLIHADQGWFVGEHGSGGCEYSVCLLLCLAVVWAADRQGLFDRARAASAA